MTVIVMNQYKENFASIGFNWPPITLGKGEIMIQKLVLDYIEKSIGDTLTIPFDFSSYMGEQSLLKMFALMVSEMDGFEIDRDNQMLLFKDSS